MQRGMKEERVLRRSRVLYRQEEKCVMPIISTQILLNEQVFLILFK